MKTKKLRVGILSRKEYKNRTIAIARGTYKPCRGEPKIWFESVRSMAHILSNENQLLLRLILEHEPASLTELEAISHRHKSNLSRTLRTLERYGVVELRHESGRIRPLVLATDFSVQFGLTTGHTG